MRVKANFLEKGWVMAIFGVCLLMVWALNIITSREVRILERKLQSVNTEFHQRVADSKALDTEWAYLTNPERIERLSKALLLDEKTIHAENIRSVDSLPKAEKVHAISSGAGFSKIYISNYTHE